MRRTTSSTLFIFHLEVSFREEVEKNGGLWVQYM